MIRAAIEDDGGGIFAMAAAMWDEVYAGRPRDAYRINALIDHLTKTGMLLVAVEDGWPVGMMALTLGDNPFTGEREAYEMALYVKPAHRRDGIARSLVAAAVDLVRSKGCVRLHAGAGGDSTDGVYEGFRRRRSYELELETSHVR